MVAKTLFILFLLHMCGQHNGEPSRVVVVVAVMWHSLTVKLQWTAGSRNVVAYVPSDIVEDERWCAGVRVLKRFPHALTDRFIVDENHASLIV